MAKSVNRKMMEAAKVLAVGLPFEEQGAQSGPCALQSGCGKARVQRHALRALATFNSPARGAGFKSRFSSNFGRLKILIPFNIVMIILIIMT